VKASIAWVKASAMEQTHGAREHVKAHSTGHIAEATAQTGARMACSAADAAERATEAIGSARRRVTANPKQYALLGAALVRRRDREGPGRRLHRQRDHDLVVIDLDGLLERGVVVLLAGRDLRIAELGLR
jgi:hypothetical protein